MPSIRRFSPQPRDHRPRLATDRRPPLRHEANAVPVQERVSRPSQTLPPVLEVAQDRTHRALRDDKLAAGGVEKVGTGAAAMIPWVISLSDVRCWINGLRWWNETRHCEVVLLMLNQKIEY